jgi:hypothetical protein
MRSHDPPGPHGQSICAPHASLRRGARFGLSIPADNVSGSA